ncbi:MAG: hypothetical protein N2484_08550 [Clostridia bacterium]|nr:hypothetical protein [Clostridia bacterium]
MYKTLDIYIYSDLSTYHMAINLPNAPDTIYAGARRDANIIGMVNPLNLKIAGYSYSDYMKSIVHELVHVVEHNINPNIPLSLDEGVAAYESGLDNGVDGVMARAKSDNKFPSLNDLQTDPVTFGKIGGYEFSYSLVEYTIKTYGYDKLLAFMKKPSEFEKVFGKSREDFEKD